MDKNSFSIEARKTEALAVAWRFAARKHLDQIYEGHEANIKYPYLTHLGLVWQELVQAFTFGIEKNIDTQLAYLCAILHDTIEDTNTSFAEISQLFGKEVAEGVSALTKNEVLPTKQEQMTDSLARIQQQPQEIWMVKLADRIVNLSPPPHYWNTTKIAAYLEEAETIYQALAPANEYLTKRLAFKIEAYKQYL